MLLFLFYRNTNETVTHIFYNEHVSLHRNNVKNASKKINTSLAVAINTNPWIVLDNLVIIRKEKMGIPAKK